MILFPFLLPHIKCFRLDAWFFRAAELYRTLKSLKFEKHLKACSRGRKARGKAVCHFRVIFHFVCCYFICVFKKILISQIDYSRSVAADEVSVLTAGSNELRHTVGESVTCVSEWKGMLIFSDWNIIRVSLFIWTVNSCWPRFMVNKSPLPVWFLHPFNPQGRRPVPVPVPPDTHFLPFIPRVYRQN